MAAGDWTPTREGAHVPVVTIAVGAVHDFDAPAGANGFMLGADGPFTITFDGSTATAPNGLGVDPQKGATGLFAVTPRGKISIFNRHTSDIQVSVAWLERLG
jgi:hypothetical protein